MRLWTPRDTDAMKSLTRVHHCPFHALYKQPPIPISNFKHFLFVRVREHAQGMSAESPMSVGPWDTPPLSVHARWPGLRGRILQNKIRETYVRKNGAHPAVVRQAARRWRRATLAATREEHPFSAGRSRRIQRVYRGTRYQARVPQRSVGSA